MVFRVHPCISVVKPSTERSALTLCVNASRHVSGTVATSSIRGRNRVKQEAFHSLHYDKQLALNVVSFALIVRSASSCCVSLRFELVKVNLSELFFIVKLLFFRAYLLVSDRPMLQFSVNFALLLPSDTLYHSLVRALCL